MGSKTSFCSPILRGLQSTIPSVGPTTLFFINHFFLCFFTFFPLPTRLPPRRRPNSGNASPPTLLRLRAATTSTLARTRHRHASSPFCHAISHLLQPRRASPAPMSSPFTSSAPATAGTSTLGLRRRPGKGRGRGRGGKASREGEQLGRLTGERCVSGGARPRRVGLAHKGATAHRARRAGARRCSGARRAGLSYGMAVGCSVERQRVQGVETRERRHRRDLHIGLGLELRNSRSWKSISGPHFCKTDRKFVLRALFCVVRLELL